MEIRDEIALALLPAIYAEYWAYHRYAGTGPEDERWREGLCLDAYLMADTMIAMSGKKTSIAGALSGICPVPEFPQAETGDSGFGRR